MSKADQLIGRTELPPFGFDEEGNPVTAGGEKLDRNNYTTKDRYVKERAILENYNKIKDLTNELQELKNTGRDGAESGQGRPRSRVRKGSREGSRSMGSREGQGRRQGGRPRRSGPRRSVNQEKMQRMRESLGEDHSAHFGPPQDLKGSA